MRRLQNLAYGGSLDTQAGTTGYTNHGVSTSYLVKLRSLVRNSIVFSNPDSLIGQPVTTVEIQLSPAGEITDVQLKQSSGYPQWDRAVLRALEKIRIPPDEQGRIVPSIVFQVGPR
jgi:colicin import membrane protein